MRSFFEFLFHELVLEIWEKTTMEEFFMKTKVFVIGFFFEVFFAYSRTVHESLLAD